MTGNRRPHDRGRKPAQVVPSHWQATRIDKPRANPKEPLSVAEARNLLAATKGHQDHAMWTVMLMLGLRRSEVCGLRWDNVDLEGRTLSVTQSVQRVEGKLTELPTKTRRSTRTIPLPAGVFNSLVEHRARRLADGGHEQPYVFGTTVGTPLEPRNLSRRRTRVCRTSGSGRPPCITCGTRAFPCCWPKGSARAR
jgi:integrase